MKVIKKGITAPKGFKANGIYCGIKKSNKLDLGLIISDVPATCAGVFTKNSVKAAPLFVSQKHIRNGEAQAIIVNSGNANCFTGEFGYIYADDTTKAVAEALNIKKQDVLVTSTGIIGKPLPIKKLVAGIPTLVKGLSTTGSKKFAESILTTDLAIKTSTVEIKISGKTVTIAACGKGSGMIAPNMATMLGFVTTDVAIDAKLLKQALQEANGISYNRITVDGCMSTNDMVVAFANGASKNKKIITKGSDYNKFVEALSFVNLEIAKKIVLDGEGASLFIEVTVSNAKTKKQAHDVVMAIANSNLVKTANYTTNPNWGRVAAAAGSLGYKGIDEKKLKITFTAKKKGYVFINADLNLGSFNATAYTSDLTKKYVSINNQYN
ncbi:MAG: glutamate N-acetyltransferase/amino-acid N-acetyltransferase [Candidatus Omnitrophota bacterium]|jgi:glutamate N-acetyltransferase/amino-acid N-acetyltransferase